MRQDDTEDCELKIRCCECNKLFNKIAHTHLRQHNLTIEEYLSKYPEARLMSPAAQELAAIAQAERNKSKIGQKHSEESKQKMREVKAKNKKPSKLIGRTKTEEHKRNLSEAKLAAFADGTIVHWNVGGSTSVETKAKISQTAKDRHKQLGTHNATEPFMFDYMYWIWENKHRIPSWLDCDTGSWSPADVKSVQSTVEHDEMAYVLNLQIKSLTARQYQVVCRDCNTEFSFDKQNLRPGKVATRTVEICPTCRPSNPYNQSKGELEMYEFIKTVIPTINVKSGDRTILGGKEFDVWIPEMNVAFEYNGVYYHSEGGHRYSKYNILEKLLLAQEKGVRLVSIDEDEWKTKQEIVESRIRQILGKQQVVLYARKCKIREIDSATSRPFLDENHIQGADTARVRYGAFYEGELVGVMTFKATTMVKGGDGTTQELSRFSTKLNTTVVGLASKMFKRFITDYNPEQVISYSDNRWNTGAVYGLLGFIKESEGTPNYWYFSPGGMIRQHRSTFMKHKLVADGFDPNKTEKEIMDERGYIRLYDAGSSKWVWNKPVDLIQ